ncbi:MAG: diacylglycerol kinase family lipid kinase [Simkaniaceae bacterium]|nr:diacylglycerol kinase family lipid kinase [Simkaniaceae bacterium]
MPFRTLLFLFLFVTSMASATPKKKILFIINPKAGISKKSTTEAAIVKHLDHDQFNYKIAYTKGPKDATLISNKAVLEKTDIIVAVGGDGTVNEVAKGLIATQSTLAIIPKGSGNGLARHLKIPMREKNAIKLINELHCKHIDTVRINDDSYIGVAGVGFDAQVSLAFEKFGKRGPASYLMVVISELQRYQPKEYELVIDGTLVHEQAFLITFANSAQYGNNVIIAPQARIDDGFLDVMIIKDFPKHATAGIVHELLNKKLDNSKYTKTYRCQEVIIKKPYSQIHIDGEPSSYTESVFIRVMPSSLKILTPETSKKM